MFGSGIDRSDCKRRRDPDRNVGHFPDTATTQGCDVAMQGRTIMKNCIILLAAAAIAATPLGPTVAQDIARVRVATHDIDLTTAKDQRVLTLRITRAANIVCGGVNDRFDTGVRIAQRACRDETTKAALATLRLPRQTASR
jgi:UrcA family protein